MAKRRRSLATIDDDFAAIDRMLRELRNRIADAAEVVRIAAAKHGAASRARGKVKRKKR